MLLTKWQLNIKLGQLNLPLTVTVRRYILLQSWHLKPLPFVIHSGNHYVIIQKSNK